MSSAFTPKVVGAFSARNIVGDTTGTSVPAGYIGEKIAATLSAGSVAMTTTNTDISGASISLSPGVWTVYYSVTNLLVSATAGGIAYAVISLTDNANTLVAGGTRASFAGGSGTTTRTGSTLQCSIPIVVSATTTYKLRVQRVDDTGGPHSGTIYVDSSATALGSTFFAVRTA